MATFNPRALWRPRLPELPEPCASCPFSTGNNKEFGAVVARLAKTWTFDHAHNNSASVRHARGAVKRDASKRGDFACHGSVYKEDMTMRPTADHRQCPGASAYYREHGARVPR